MDPRRPAGRPPRPSAQPGESFRDFEATALFCNRCRAPRPVRERLLLVLPDGEMREYLCAVCTSSLGTRRLTLGGPLVAG
jgi:hypothetical protein